MKIDKESLKLERDGLIDLIDKLRKPYQKILTEIDNILWEEEVKEAETNVGKCFVYRRNCYSCPKKESDYWDTYLKICGFHKAVDNDDFDRYIVIRCEKDSYGLIKLSQENYSISYPRFEDYEEISSEEFDKVYKNLLAELEGK